MAVKKPVLLKSGGAGMKRKTAAELAQANEKLRDEIAERLKAEAELHRVKEQWERTFNTVPDLIAILDDRHRITRVNLAMARALGVEPDQCVGQHCYQCVHGAAAPPQTCPHAQTMRDGQEHVAEVHEERLGGDFLVSTTPMFDADGKLIGSVHVARDITERKRSERMLRELNETLEQRVAERTAVAERHAVELRRLTAELSQAEHNERERLARLLHDDLQQLILAARLRLAGVNCGNDDAIRSALVAIDGLLGDSMAVSRNLSMELSPPILHRGSLGEALEWLGEWFGDKHGLAVEVDVQAGLMPAEHVRVFLFQSARELLLNAMKHSGSMEARLELSHQGGDLSVAVEDRGAGFDPAAVEKKLNAAQSFGLPSIRERIESFGGRLEIGRTPAGGARFRMIVPMAGKSGALDAPADGR